MDEVFRMVVGVSTLGSGGKRQPLFSGMKTVILIRSGRCKGF